MSSRRQGVNLFRGKSIIVSAILVIADAVIFPIPGRTQQVLTGEFSLSQEVRWGNSVLPMGDYAYFVDSNRSPVVVRVQQKDGTFSGVFLPTTFLRPGKQGKTGIVFASIGSNTYVTAILLPEMKGELNFPTAETETENQPADQIHARENGVSSARTQEYLTILNPNHEKMSMEEAEKVYLRACEAVEKEFNRSTPVRPHLILRLGGSDDVLHYPMQEIQLKKWDKYRFADAVVELALHDMLSLEDKARLRNIAVNEAGATVSICELKTCVN
jgi:hypothetical protein